MMLQYVITLKRHEIDLLLRMLRNRPEDEPVNDLQTTVGEYRTALRDQWKKLEGKDYV